MCLKAGDLVKQFAWTYDSLLEMVREGEAIEGLEPEDQCPSLNLPPRPITHRISSEVMEIVEDYNNRL
jgi:hypothetical protein